MGTSLQETFIWCILQPFSLSQALSVTLHGHFNKQVLGTFPEPGIVGLRAFSVPDVGLTKGKEEPKYYPILGPHSSTGTTKGPLRPRVSLLWKGGPWPPAQEHRAPLRPGREGAEPGDGAPNAGFSTRILSPAQGTLPTLMSHQTAQRAETIPQKEFGACWAKHCAPPK